MRSAAYCAPGPPQNEENNSHDQKNRADVVEQADARNVAEDQQDKAENDQLLHLSGERRGAAQDVE